MNPSPRHLVVTLSGHGFGHAAMTAPLINLLGQRHPHLKITLRSRAPRWFLDAYYRVPFDYCNEGSDFGMVMDDAFLVDRAASAHRYRQFHAHWHDHLRREESRLRNLGADLLLSNIAYLPLQAARNLAIPAIAFCCLNWADIYRHYFGDDAIYRTIMEAYRAADLFIRPEPAMPMPSLKTCSVGPVASLGRNQGAEIRARLGLSSDTRLVLASLGGVATELGVEQWPALSQVHYLLPGPTATARPDLSTLEEAGMGFTDALASSDLFITKPGYGAFSEAACHGVPVLYAKREWPEQPYLVDWLKRRLPCAAISPDALRQGRFSAPLRTLLASERPAPLPPSGIEQALNEIEKFPF